MLSLVILTISLAAFQTAAAASQCTCPCEEEITTTSGPGGRDKKTIEVSGFNNVATFGPFEIEVKFGAEESVEVEADSRILPLVDAVNNGGSLSIHFDEDDWWKLNHKGPINVVVHAKALNALYNSGHGSFVVSTVWKAGSVLLEQSGTGNITVPMLDVSGLKVTVSGKGNVLAGGKCQSADLTLNNDLGWFYGEKLKAQTARITVQSRASAFIGVEKTLTVKMKGNGAVIYNGNPKVNQDITGTGTVFKSAV